MATPNSLAVEILQEMEKATDDAGFVARVEKRVNDALDEIAIATNFNMFKTRTTFNTVASQAQYTLPVGGRAISQLRYTDTGAPILHATTPELARFAAKLEDGGRATHWIEDGVTTSGSDVLYQFRLAPVPEDELEIEEEYYYFPSEAATGTVIPIQDQYLPLVRRFVRASLLRLYQMYDQAKMEEQRYDSLLEQLVKHEKRPINAQTRMVANDLRRDGRNGQAQFDGSHFQNPWI